MAGMSKKKAIERIKKKVPKINEEVLYVPTGLSLLNLAASNKAKGGFPVGKFYNLCGGTHAGKTLMAYTMLAETANNPAFDDYRLVKADSEAADEFDVKGMFGLKLDSRLELTSPNSIEDFHVEFDDCCKDDKPFIYVLDSLDSLTSAAQTKEFNATMDAIRKDNKLPGSYGMSKAKAGSRFFSEICGKLAEKKSMLLIISQIRDNIDPVSPVKHTRSGGNNLDFYASIVAWVTSVGKINSKVGDIKLTIESKSKIKFSKNKVTGVSVSEIPFQMSPAYGIDNIRSNIDFLISSSYWSGNGNGVNTKGFVDDKIPRRELIDLIERENREGDLDDVMQKAWDTLVLPALKPVERKSKYE